MTGRVNAPSPYTCKGYQQITSLSSAVGLDIPVGAIMALLQAETQDVRWRDDGTDPTGSVGMVLKAGDPPFVYMGDLAAITFIEATASAKLNVTYYA